MKPGLWYAIQTLRWILIGCSLIMISLWFQHIFISTEEWGMRKWINHSSILSMIVGFALLSYNVAALILKSKSRNEDLT